MRPCSFLVSVAVLGVVCAMMVPVSRRCSFPPEPREAKTHRVTFQNGTKPPVVVTYQREVPAPIVEAAKPVLELEPAPAQVPPAGAAFGPRVVATNDGWLITGEPQKTREEARRAALTLAQGTVERHLQAQEPQIRWHPSLGFVDRLVKATGTEKDDEGGTYRTTLTVRMTSDSWAEIRRHEREGQAQERMFELGKLLAALVALLAAVAGYFRLDEMTKGYYTGWLRLAAGCLAGAALVLMLA